MENRELFYDMLTRFYAEEARKNKWLDDESARLMHKILDDSKVFLINGAVADDLSNVPHDSTEYRATFHLPFKSIFFELMDPLKIQIGPVPRTRVKGILFKKAEKEDGFLDDIWENEFSMSLFREDILQQTFRLPDFVYFVPQCLPEMTFLSREGVYSYTLESGFTSTAHSDLPHDPAVMQKSFQSFLDLTVNLVDYINAHNVTLRKVDRETRTQEEVDRINRKRQAKGKSLVNLLKPFYWVDVRQATERTGKKIECGGQEQDYREWVRGHFQRYHTNLGTVKDWINPYVRGPEGAPWKENRYRVLADMLANGTGQDFGLEKKAI